MTQVQVDAQKLAHLARIAVDETELAQVQKEISDILAFVDQIQEAVGEVHKIAGDHHNVFREDGDPHESGVYSEDLIDAMPNSKDGYLQVRKIISQD